MIAIPTCRMAQGDRRDRQITARSNAPAAPTFPPSGRGALAGHHHEIESLCHSQAIDMG